MPWEDSHDSAFFAKEAAEKTWNFTCEHIANQIKKRNKEFQGSWKHEDIDILLEDIEKMVVKT